MNNSTYGIHFVLKKNEIINGLAPIYSRTTVDSKRCEISAKRKISTENWDFGKGLAYIDVMHLTPEQIQIGINKELWLFTSREKTDNTVFKDVNYIH